MEKNIALIVVDLQNDFCEGGSLPIKDANSIIPVINSMLPVFKTVIFTKDWHPHDSLLFASQHNGAQPFDKDDESGEVLWPDHCVQNTPGADLNSKILFGQIFGNFYIFKKGMDRVHHPFSGFDGTELYEFLNEREIDTLYVVGLATDYCCSATALDAVELGFKTYFVLDATRGVNPDNSVTVRNLEERGVRVIMSSDILA